MNRKLPTGRRAFLRVAAMSAAASAVPTWIPRSVLGEGPRPGANDRITVGVIGTGGRSNLLIDQ
ncbi:MAG: gfo/Idh/MocA family oxidoreductase, partial [Thermogutta sp.]|nr:gfo/Idh/MocA family oxidoreductase [Thermogutta sp.]